jgi:hypothetical protein
MILPVNPKPIRQSGPLFEAAFAHDGTYSVYTTALITFSSKFVILLGQPMSKRACHAVRMKMKKSIRFLISCFSLFGGAYRQIVAVFGTSRLIRNQK